MRGGTAKLLTLFHPADGQVRALPVEQATNAVLHPWLKRELRQIVASLPEPTAEQAACWGNSWVDWGLAEEARLFGWPPLRLILVWDNLAGHYSAEMVVWCHQQGVLPLYTPLGGSWLNMAESVQRILIRRALSGQHPESAQQIMDWLDATVRGWNADPTPFEWGGKRWQRRQRSRERHKLGGSHAYTRRPVRRRWQSDERSHSIHAVT
jgi:transposase